MVYDAYPPTYIVLFYMPKLYFYLPWPMADIVQEFGKQRRGLLLFVNIVIPECH